MLDDAWQKIGAMLYRLIRRADDLPLNKSPISIFRVYRASIFNPLSSALLNLQHCYRRYSFLIRPDASISLTRLKSTKALGSALAALGFLTAKSSSIVFTPSGVG